jgi:hypothetical protein
MPVSRTSIPPQLVRKISPGIRVSTGTSVVPRAPMEGSSGGGRKADNRGQRESCLGFPTTVGTETSELGTEA